MATRKRAVPQNKLGRFFVDSTCIFCELCVLTAPEIFNESKTDGWAYVFKQPITLLEFAAAEALEGCPTESIGAENYDPVWRTHKEDLEDTLELAAARECNAGRPGTTLHDAAQELNL